MKISTTSINIKASLRLMWMRIVLPALKIVGWSLTDLCQSFMRPKRSSAALTYHTLFAIVPVLSLMVAVAKGLGYADEFRMQVKEFLHGQEVVSSSLLNFTDTYLNNTHQHSWLGAGVGLVVLLYSVFSIFMTIDEEFNHQWEERGRSFLQLLRTFAFVLVIPFAVIVLLAIWWSVSALFKGSLIFSSHTLIIAAGVYVVWLFVMYKFIPKCKVEWGCALLSAAVSGAIFCGMQYFSYAIITMFGNYRNVYGDLASLIIFLLWIYFSWTICLAGAHWTYLLQTAREKRMREAYAASSLAYKRFLIYVIVQRIKAIYPITLQLQHAEFVQNMSAEFGLSEHILEDLLNQMTDRSILLSENDDESKLSETYIKMTDDELLHALDFAGQDSHICAHFSKIHNNPQFREAWNKINHVPPYDTFKI